MSPPDVLARTAGTASRVAAAALTDVKVSDFAATVADVRGLFAGGHVHCAVVVRRGMLVTVVDRDDVTDAVPDAAPLAGMGRLHGRVIHQDADSGDALDAMLASGRRRLAVVDGHGRFVGLLCLKRSRSGFCSDRDVLNRRRAREDPRISTV